MTDNYLYKYKHKYNIKGAKLLKMDQNRRGNITHVGKDGKVNLVDEYNENLNEQDMCDIVIESLAIDE